MRFVWDSDEILAEIRGEGQFRWIIQSGFERCPGEGGDHVFTGVRDTRRCSGLSSHPSSRSGSGVCVEPRTASRVPGRHSGHIPDVISLPVRNPCSARAFHDLSCHTHEQVTAPYVRDPHASVTVHGCSRVESRSRAASSWALSGPEGTVSRTDLGRRPGALGDPGSRRAPGA